VFVVLHWHRQKVTKFLNNNYNNNNNNKHTHAFNFFTGGYVSLKQRLPPCWHLVKEASRQRDQKVSVHLTITVHITGAQRIFDHPVVQRKILCYLYLRVSLRFLVTEFQCVLLSKCLTVHVLVTFKNNLFKQGQATPNLKCALTCADAELNGK